MTVRITWRYLVAFAALTMLCGTSHEFAHHFAGAALCGEFGSKTFNSFSLAPSCDVHLWRRYGAAWAGPLFTFALVWVGYVMLRRGDEPLRRMGFALIFANFPVNRMLFALLGQNDEQYANRLVFGRHPWVFCMTTALVWGVCLPPLVECFRQLRNRPRVAWFAGFLLLPFCFVVAFAGWLEVVVLNGHQILANGIIGIPWLVLLVEAVSFVLFRSFKAALSAPTPAPVEAFSS